MKKRYMMVLLAAFIAATAVLLFIIYIEKPPVELVSSAQDKLYEARQAGASAYSLESYNKATAFYDSAISAWQTENNRFILFRNYRNTENYALKSEYYASLSVAHAADYKSKIEERILSRIFTLELRLQDFENSFGNFPMTNSQHELLAKVEMKIREGKQAFAREDYSSCQQMFDFAETSLIELSAHFNAMLTSYMESNHLWSEMTDKAVKSSKRGAASIVIDKLSRECYLYVKGEKAHTFQVELGRNWLGDKVQQGDKRTPEGIYTITEKKSGGMTRYYKALLLDYPNEEDRRRFLQNKKRGEIANTAKIGNHIEIHGDGGKGIDWTDGCVALVNSDMDTLFKLVGVGTKVYIVGSTGPTK